MSMKIVGNTGSKNPSIWNDLDKEYFSKMSAEDIYNLLKSNSSFTQSTINEMVQANPNAEIAISKILKNNTSAISQNVEIDKENYKKYLVIAAIAGIAILFLANKKKRKKTK